MRATSATSRGDGFLDFFFDPAVVVLDELNEFITRSFHRDTSLDDFLTDVQVNLTRSTTNITEIRIRHLTRTVDDATHNGDGDARQVSSLLLDLRRDFLQVEEGASARRARDVLRLRVTHTRALEQTERGRTKEVQ